MSRQNSREVSSLEVTLNGSQVNIDPFANGTKPFDDVKVMLLKGEKGDKGEQGDPADLKTLAPDFSESTAYAVGAFVNHDGKLYVCTTAHSAGAWNASHFTETSVDNSFMAKGRDYVTAGKASSSTVAIHATAEGSNTTATADSAHAEGSGSHATGTASHAEGGSTTASERQSHAEGLSSIASGIASHAENEGTTSSNRASHAEGYYTTASHTASHSEGYYTKTGNAYQHVQGKYNEGKATTSFEIGKGTSNSARSNALEGDWSGNVLSAGTITDGTGNVLSNKLNASDPASSVEYSLSLRIGDTDEIFNGSANKSIRWFSYVIPVNSSDWSATVNGDGYYTNDIAILPYGSSLNAGVQPIISCCGSDKNTLPTNAQKSAYNLCEKFWFDDVAQSALMTVYAKTKPTETFYIMLTGINTVTI